MVSLGDTFEPKTVLSILKDLEPNTAAKKAFETQWNQRVKGRCDGWMKHKDNQYKSEIQLKWEAEVVEYVDYIHHQTALHGNAGPNKTAPTLKKQVPLLGPRFEPPSYLHLTKREPTPAIVPETLYLIPLTVIHPVYFPGLISICPKCRSTNIRWDGWNGTGGRQVHGVRRNERAIGFQLRCKECHGSDGKGYCHVTTSSAFWEKWEHWEIPRNIPHFLYRSAVTRELYDLVIEMRLGSTSAGLAEGIKQLHLLEYHQCHREYVTYFKSAGRRSSLNRKPLQRFSEPYDTDGYNDSPITNDIISDIYVNFADKTREVESTEYCKTRTGVSLSLDNTFKSAAKAVVVGKDHSRNKLFKGGILSVINEKSDTMAWRFCQSASPAEIGEILGGIHERHNILQVPQPCQVVVDNCCQVRRQISAKMPQTAVELDVWHLMARYAGVMLDNTRNPFRGEVLMDIRNAILERPAGKSGPARYWSKEVQEAKLTSAYDKWARRGGVWSAAASKVHSDQLTHVKKGCPARVRQDIRADGSRIEGSHKGWNSIQRAQPSGLLLYNSLAHDFVHRRNIRIGTSRLVTAYDIKANQFLASTYGSHHTRLVNHTAHEFNALYENESQASKQTLQQSPLMARVETSEKFGLIESAHTTTFGGLLNAKEEEDEPEIIDEDGLLNRVDEVSAEMDQTLFIQQLNIDPKLLSIPAERPPIATSDSVNINKGKRKETAPFETPVPADLLFFGPSSSKRARYNVSPSETAELLEESANQMLVDSEMTEPGVASTPPSWILKEIGPLTNEAMSVDCEPTIMTAPLITPTSNAGAAGVGALFKFSPASYQKPPAAPISGPLLPDSSFKLAKHQVTEPVAMLTQALPLPAGSKLTRSEQLFQTGTSLNPRMLSIKGDDEFFLFMDMRAELQWASFSMTSQRWAEATTAYNARLGDIQRKKGLSVMKKNPRALMEKLGEMESKILDRILKQEFKSKRRGSDDFWLKHCYAVALVKADPGTSTSMETMKKRKVAICSRCKTVMYPGPTGAAENHKRSYCSDGVCQKLKTGSVDLVLPEWPQPQGIFTNGKEFHAIKFLSAVRTLYEKVVGRTVEEVDLSAEDISFSRMVESRVSVVDG